MVCVLESTKIQESAAVANCCHKVVSFALAVVFLCFVIEIKNLKQIQYVNLRKAKRAACKRSKSRMRLASHSLATTAIECWGKIVFSFC